MPSDLLVQGTRQRANVPVCQIPNTAPKRTGNHRKHKASTEEFETFVQRQCKFAQLLPNQQLMKPFNQATNYGPQHQPEIQKKNDKDNAQTKKKCEGIEGSARSMDINGQNAENDKGKTTAQNSIPN